MTIPYQRKEIIGAATLYLGDCREILPTLPKVDAVITDPPYGLGFMGKHWDKGVPSAGIWAEALRVLKPGGHLLAFAGTRTQHRMAVNIEDAGFEIRDMIAWVYGSGFPKSHNLKGEWAGWGTALKPALEPITVARKPFKGTVAANVLEHGTGAINIDGCRVGTEENLERVSGGAENSVGNWGMKRGHTTQQPSGRWPANLIHDGSDEVLGLFPMTKSGGPAKTRTKDGKEKGWGMSAQPDDPTKYNGGDQGSAARFFYCAKASKKDRGADNKHPTVKPTDLMRYLCRLVTPPNGIVLDLFMGSGTTGVACMNLGRQFIGIEREPKYFDIACRRIEDALRQERLFA